MGSGAFWGWMMWLHLGFLLVPVLIACMKFELDDLRRFRPTYVTRVEHENSERPAA